MYFILFLFFIYNQNYTAYLEQYYGNVFIRDMWYLKAAMRHFAGSAIVYFVNHLPTS